MYFCKSQKIRIKRHLIITRLVRASRVRSVQDSCCPRFAMSLARFGHVTFTVARPTNRVREVRHVPSQVAPSSRSATRLARYPKPQIFQHASRAGSPHVTADAPPNPCLCTLQKLTNTRFPDDNLLPLPGKPVAWAQHV